MQKVSQRETMKQEAQLLLGIWKEIVLRACDVRYTAADRYL